MVIMMKEDKKKNPHNALHSKAKNRVKVLKEIETSRWKAHAQVIEATIWCEDKKSYMKPKMLPHYEEIQELLKKMNQDLKECSKSMRQIRILLEEDIEDAETCLVLAKRKKDKWKP